MAVEHRGLAAVEAPAVGRLPGRGVDVSEIEARRALRMGECETQRAVGDLGKDGLPLRIASAFRYQCGADHHCGKIRLADQPAPERFHQDTGFDRAAAQPAMGFIDRQRQPAEIGELLPDFGTEAERIGRRAATMIGVIGLGDEAVDAFAQQALLVAQGKVHLNYFTTACFLTEG
jgi:hypothetical protein